MKGAATLAFLLACVAALPARASVQSQALSARGLVALNAGDTAAALSLFEQAVTADPRDADALYHRAVARARLGDQQSAIADFEAALALKPDFAAAALQLGILEVEGGQFAKAEPRLKQAQSQPALDAQASFFLGLAQLQLARYDEARQNFARARSHDPSLVLATQYYEGVITFRQGDLRSAEDAFEAVEHDDPTSVMGRESASYLELIRRRRGPTYRLFASMAFEYDSNVNIGPDTTDVVAEGITGEDDGRFVINFGGQYTPLTWERVRLGVSYEFYQSAQFQLNEFNLQDHRPAIQLTYSSGLITAGLLGRYDYYLLGSDSFLQEAGWLPWVSVREEGFGRTELFYAGQWRDYKQINFSVLNGLYQTFGVRQFIDVGATGQRIWLGGAYKFTEAEHSRLAAQSYQYEGMILEAGVRWLLPYDLDSELGYRFEGQYYSGASADAFRPVGSRRKDYNHRLIFVLERPLPEIYQPLVALLSYYGTFNESNKTDFEYTRQIVSLGLQVRF